MYPVNITALLYFTGLVQLYSEAVPGPAYDCQNCSMSSAEHSPKGEQFTTISSNLLYAAEKSVYILNHIKDKP
jgi:hypothetical protein